MKELRGLIILVSLHMKKRGLLAAAVLAISALLAGCGQNGAQQQGAGKQVKAMQVLQQDTALSSEYAGQVRSLDQVSVQARVSGNIIEKYFHGGDYVTAGQPLYRVDSRQYEAAVLQAQANLAQSQATLNNARVDLARYEELLKSDSIAEQTVATQRANVNAYEAAVAANEALLLRARQDLDDTVVYAPISGKLGVDDVAVGTYATAGNTTLVTLGSDSPVYIQFSISETEYLKFMGMRNYGDSNDPSNLMVDIKLSDGTEYPIKGRLVAADRSLAENTGTLTVRAVVDNPNGALLSGMFARVKLTGSILPNAMLVPQRAIQQLLGKSFVLVVGPDNKSVTKTVTVGTQIGSYVVIEDGLEPSDVVVVEGLTNLQEGTPLSVTMVTGEDMGFSLESLSEQVNASGSNS